MPKRGDPWFKFYPDDWLRGTRNLTLEQRGAYIDAICMQMLYEAPLPDDYSWLAHQMHISIRKARSIVEGLIEARKLVRTEQGIINERRSFELVSKLNQRRVNAEIAANREREKRENLEKINKINVNYEISCHEKGTTRARTDSDTDIDIKYTPLPPKGGGQAQSELPLTAAQERKAQKAAERRKLVEEAVASYNAAAERLGFAVCRSVTQARFNRIEKRLRDIGGLENFRKALQVVERDDFLMGRKSRPGEPPFRLTIDRLCSTETSMGDVLARLLDQADEPQEQNLVGPNGKRWGWWRGKEEALRSLPVERWEAAFREAKPNGTWPWWILTAPPGHPESLFPKELSAKYGLEEIFKGQIVHD